jgi:hypothetical protein
MGELGLWMMWVVLGGFGVALYGIAQRVPVKLEVFRVLRLEVGGNGPLPHHDPGAGSLAASCVPATTNRPGGAG